jgi:hypothetical protein
MQIHNLSCQPQRLRTSSCKEVEVLFFTNQVALHQGGENKWEEVWLTNKLHWQS